MGAPLEKSERPTGSTLRVRRDVEAGLPRTSTVPVVELSSIRSIGAVDGHAVAARGPRVDLSPVGSNRSGGRFASSEAGSLKSLTSSKSRRSHLVGSATLGAAGRGKQPWMSVGVGAALIAPARCTPTPSAAPPAAPAHNRSGPRTHTQP